MNAAQIARLGACTCWGWHMLYLHCAWLASEALLVVGLHPSFGRMWHCRLLVASAEFTGTDLYCNMHVTLNGVLQQSYQHQQPCGLSD